MIDFDRVEKSEEHGEPTPVTLKISCMLPYSKLGPWCTASGDPTEP